MPQVELSDDEWKHKLTPEQFRVLRKKGTEAPFTGELLQNTATGDYVCAACGNVLFKSNSKFDSTEPGLQGWPSFSDVAGSDAVVLTTDHSLLMRRTEVTCKRCGSHLGHLFQGGDSPTGRHYCINSTAMQFLPKK